MKRRLVLCLLVLVMILPAASFAAGKKCATKYPVVLAHGMGRQAEGNTPYWSTTPETLAKNGAAVFVTNVNAWDSTANKARAWKRQVLDILAVTGAKKVNVIGHSHGAVYSRYAITNLGLAPKVASHTSICGPHRGSRVADLLMSLIPDKLERPLGSALDLLFSALMGDVKGNTIANGCDMTTLNMKKTFNPNTPNVPGIYYQSYAAKVSKMIGGGLWAIPWKIITPYVGDNDGLVAVKSAQWGNFRGVITGIPLLGGVNHTAAVRPSFLPTPGYDPPSFFKSVVTDLKKRGY